MREGNGAGCRRQCGAVKAAPLPQGLTEQEDADEESLGVARRDAEAH